MKWINVKDKLPDENLIVLVWNKDAVEMGFYWHREWRDYSELFRHVTHWMLLPEPPE